MKQCKCNKKQITSCIRISANIITSGFISSQFASMVFTKNRNFLAPSKDLSSSSTFSQSSSLLPHAHAWRSSTVRACTEAYKRTVVLLLATSPRYHFQAHSRSSSDRFPTRIIPSFVFPSTHIYDVVIFRWRIRHRYVISS